MLSPALSEARADLFGVNGPPSGAMLTRDVVPVCSRSLIRVGGVLVVI